MVALGAATSIARVKPNIIFITADNQGYGDAGIYNPESKIPTPGLDRIAKEGIRFTDAHAGSAVCTPTRYGLLTGRYAWRSRLQKGVMVSGDKDGCLIDGPVAHGFDEFHGFHHAREMHSWAKDDRVVETVPLDQVIARKTEASIRFIKDATKASKTFFLYLALGSPHTPIVPSDQWSGKSGINP
jgi:arylsulfatase A-like enzyme